MGDCRTGTCPTVRYEAPRPTYQQPEKSWCQSAACDAYAGKGTTTVYDGQTKPQYDKMAESFKFNGSKGSNEKGGVQDAYAEAIRTGKPLVVVMGKFDGNNPRNVVDQTQKNAKDDAVYLYVDPTTCKDEQLKAYAEQRLKGGHNASMTDVFEFTPGKDGGPPDMKKVHSWQGGDPSMVASFKDALSKTHDNMTANKDKFSKEPMGPTEIEQKQIADAKAKAVAEKAAADKAAADKAAADKAVADKAAADKAAADKAVADKAAADKAAAEKATAEKAAAEKAAAEKAAAEKTAAEKTAAEKTAADLKAAEEKGRLAGRAEVKAETAKVVSDVIDLTVPIVPITRAGVQVGQKAVEFVAEHPKEAAIIAAPAIAIPVLATKEVVDFAVKNPDVAAKVVIAGAMPIIPVVTGGAKLARKAYDLLPEKPSWLP